MPRPSDQAISPSVTSIGDTGVLSTASYSFAYLSLKNTLNVVSMIAPFMIELASMAGATKAAYDSVWPSGPVTSPTSLPTPTPSESR